MIKTLGGGASPPLCFEHFNEMVDLSLNKKIFDDYNK